MAEALAIVTAATAGVRTLSRAKPAFWDPLMKKIASSKDVKETLDALNDAVGVLQSERKDYENEVETHKTKVPSETYKQWICRVKKIENKVEELVTKYDEQSKNSCLFSCSRSDLIKQMQKTGEQVDKLLKEGDQLKDKLLTNPNLERVVKNKEVPQIKDFETRQKPLEQILDLLKNDKVNGIGICGTVGIGKTTIMQNLNNHEEIVKMFDIVIWVKVSTEGSKENLSRENLQQAIVQRLKIQMEDNNNADEVAEKISMVLKGTKCLLLLDDVKENLNLHQIGIPDNHNGSKFVLTTRLHHVCSSMVDKVIKMTYLSPDEAWEMFQAVLQNPKLVSNSIIGPLAWRVCQECGGLPLLIEKVANTFKLKNNECLWSDGLNSWRMWPEKECQGIKEMYKLLKFCYDDLDDDQQKKCFLYSALYPEDDDIYTYYLLECWAAEDLLGHDVDTTKVRAMIGHLILSRLKNVSLLEESKIEDHVTMHKFVRQMALNISEDIPDCRYLVKTNKALKQPPGEESWFEKNGISLGGNELDKLPDSPNCSMLSTLFLQKNLSLNIIPESFFEHMKNLRVLNLSHTGIRLLPSSISTLISLEILYLNDCKYLVELPSHIVELFQLEALDIRQSGINNIPPHIEKLIHLRRLRVSFTEFGYENATQEVHFDYDMISRFSRLEELVIDVKSLKHWSNEVVEKIIKEVATLKKFKKLQFCFSNKVVDVIKVTPMTLCVHVPEASILLSFINNYSWCFHSIRSFQLFVGCQDSEHPQIPDFVRYEKYIKYCNGAGSDFPIVTVLFEADAFELINHEDIKQLSDLEIASMKKVRCCLIESCNAMKTVMSTANHVVLPNLEHLYLKSLPKLEGIWKGLMLPGSLTKLKTLVLTDCQLLVNVFIPGMIQQLCEIQYLKIEKCSKVEEIIAKSGAGNLKVLPKLKELILIDMPNLRSICANDSSDWQSLAKLEICKCPSLCELPFNKDNAKKLKLIEAEEHWWDALKWQTHEVRKRFEQFCKFRS